MAQTVRGSVRDAMSAGAPRLKSDSTIAEGAFEVWRNGWLPLPVVDDDGKLIGTLAANDIVRAVAQRLDPQQQRIGEIAASEIPTVGPDEPLADAASTMQRAASGLVLVVEEERLAGILTRSDIEGHELVQKELGPLAAEVVTEVSPNDLMYAGSWGAYAYAGVTALQCIREVLAEVGRPAPASILDLPCGHGRELRFLKLAFPDARFGVCDIDEDGVEFCARVFGGHPIVSHEDPAQVRFDRRYELAWSGSLFTHLSAERWQGFLEMFARAVEPGGLVLFSSNGYLSASTLRNLGLVNDEVERLQGDFRRERFGYVEVGDGSWGLSIARPGWVKEQVERSPLELVSFERGGWKPPYPAQDVAVCTVPAA